MFGNFFTPTNRRRNYYADDSYSGYASPSNIYSSPAREQRLATLRAQEAEALRRRNAERERLKRAQAYIPGGYIPYEDDEDEPRYDYGFGRTGYANPRATAIQEQRRRQLREWQEQGELRERKLRSPDDTPIAPKQTQEGQHIRVPIQDKSSQQSTYSKDPATAPPTSTSIATKSTEEQNEAASKIQRAYRTHRSLARIAFLEAKFEEHRRHFTFPEVIDFQLGPSGEIISLYTTTATTVSSSTTDSLSKFDMNSAKLAFTAQNRPLHAHIEELNRLLTSLDAVDSYGEKRVRERRKAVVKNIEAHLASIEGLEESVQLDQGWRGVWRKALASSAKPTS